MIEPFLRTALIAHAEAYAAQRGLTLGYVSRVAFKDARFITKLKKRGGSFTARKFDEAMDFFTENWPAGRHRPPVPHIEVEDGNRKPRSRRNPGASNGKKGIGKKGRRRSEAR